MIGLALLAQAADDVDVAQNVGFYIIAAVMVVAAVRVVTSNNVVHAALWLVLVLAGVAAQYILAAAEFVAVSQVLVYIGAVMVLFLFGIMLTRAQIGAEQNLNNRNWGIGIPVAFALLGLLGWAIIDQYGDDKLPDRVGPTPTQDIADARAVGLPRPVPRPLVHPPRRRHRRHRLGQEGLTCWPSTSCCSGRCCSAAGVYGVLARRNAVMVLMAVELILNAVNLNLVAFALMTNTIDGQMFALYVIGVAAAEVGVGLAMVILVYRNRRSISLDQLSGDARMTGPTAPRSGEDSCHQPSGEVPCQALTRSSPEVDGGRRADDRRGVVPRERLADPGDPGRSPSP